MTGTQRVVRIPIYWVIVGVAVMFLSPLLSFLMSVRVAEANAAETRAQQAKSEAATAAAGRAVVCAWFAAWLDVYDETPPVSDTGRAVRAKTLELYQITGCQPPRK
jgi:hypothetical protein